MFKDLKMSIVGEKIEKLRIEMETVNKNRVDILELKIAISEIKKKKTNWLDNISLAMREEKGSETQR